MNCFEPAYLALLRSGELHRRAAEAYARLEVDRLREVGRFVKARRTICQGTTSLPQVAVRPGAGGIVFGIVRVKLDGFTVISNSAIEIPFCIITHQSSENLAHDKPIRRKIKITGTSWIV